MFERLYPKDTEGSLLSESTEKEVIENPLRMAQEYEAAFGRTDLRRFLRQSIRDEDFEPGETHLQLLKLPWRDVFTTNWDTLLERTSVRVTEHDYSLVRNVDDIPIANQPRIVKLHGSLAEHIPPILTEEDYRTYPTKFAPFVNTVQQAMMETVFCLIGFSGDDPNFLHWSGWVRDNLGDAAPKIYLAGLLDLSPHRRRMLADRGVVPIDVARHPKAHEWPEHLRPRYAVEWVLHTLERGEPYDIVDWPSPSTEPKSEVRDYLQPVSESTSERPKAEPGSPSQVDPEERHERVRQTLKAWKHNRQIYPGWLFFPASDERHLLSERTDAWEPQILTSLPHFAPVERLNAVRELVWRREVLLEPMSQHLESAAENVLGSIDCQSRTMKGPADTPVKGSAIREAWRTIALALVTDARLSLNRDLFDQRIDALSPYVDDDPNVDHRIKNERCLWAIYSMDFESLEVLLGDWQVEQCDPVWMIRKAALLRELDRRDDAAELGRRALEKIRSIRDDDRSLAGASREGWALWSTWTIENQRSVRKRWDELAPLKCNALLENDLIVRRLSGGDSTQEAPLFDLGHQRGPSWRISGANPYAAPYRAILLSDIAALSLGATSEILKLAADKLAAIQPELAILLVLRVCNYEKDDALMRVLSRTRVAALAPDSAARLAQICIGLIKHHLLGVIPGGFWAERLRVAIEVLSRLVLRATSDMGEEILDLGLECYRNSQVSRAPWLYGPLKNVLERSWKSLPEHRRTCHVLDLLGAPIIGMNGFTAAIEDQYPDPGDFLQKDRFALNRTPDNDSRWQDVISFLLRGLGGGRQARERASLRIVSVVFRSMLTEAESSAVAQAIWVNKHTPPSDLPRNTELDDWVFLLLPEPTPGLADQLFRRKWLPAADATREDPPNVEESLYQVGVAISSLQARGRSLSFSNEEKEHLLGLVARWAEAPAPEDPIPYWRYRARQPTRQALDGLSAILTEIEIPAPVAHVLYEKLKALTESETPAFGLIHGLVKAMDDRFDELVTWLRIGLVSNDISFAASAVSGLHSWLKATAGADSSLRPPPDDVVREIGFVIAARRHAALPQALQLAKWLFDEGAQAHRNTVSTLVLHGLRYLAEELRYDRDHDEGIDVPLLRWLCAQLAQSMAQSGLRDDPAVVHWLELAEQDPLPEVRFAVSPRTAPGGDG